jgi:hypothetical protein
MSTEQSGKNLAARPPGGVIADSIRPGRQPQTAARLLLGLGAAGPVIFIATYLIDGATQPDYSWWHDTISTLSLGRHGWIQAASFVLYGVLTLCFGEGLRRSGGVRPWGYALLVVAGLAPDRHRPVPDRPGPRLPGWRARRRYLQRNDPQPRLPGRVLGVPGRRLRYRAPPAPRMDRLRHGRRHPVSRRDRRVLRGRLCGAWPRGRRLSGRLLRAAADTAHRPLADRTCKERHDQPNDSPDNQPS